MGNSSSSLKSSNKKPILGSSIASGNLEPGSPVGVSNPVQMPSFAPVIKVNDDEVIPRTEAERKLVAQEDYLLEVSCHNQFDSETFNEEIKDFLGMISIDAPAYELTGRAAVDIVAVLDKSGSMAGEKISLLRKAMRRLVRNLGENDRVALITFDTQVKTVMGFTKMDKSGRDKAKKIIGDIKQGSSTNLCGGLTEAIEMLQNQNNQEKNQVQAILLFTDGEANAGPATTKEGILEEVRSVMGNVADPKTWAVPQVLKWLEKMNLSMYKNTFRENGVDGRMLIDDLTPDILETDLSVKKLHISKFTREIEKLRGPQVEGNEGETGKGNSNPTFVLHTFGFGASHNTNLLEALANECDGMYFFMKNEKAIMAGFANVLGGLLSVTAKDLILTLTLNPQISDFDVKKDEDKTVNGDGSITITYADLQAEESRHVVVSCTLPKLKKADPNFEIFTCTLKYNNLVKKIPSQETKVCTINRSGKRGKLDLAVDVEHNRVISAQAMSVAEKFGEANDLKSARLLVQKTIDRIQDSASHDDMWTTSAVSDLQNVMDGLKDRNAYETGGHQYLMQNQMCWQQERAANYEENYSSIQGYNTNSRQVMFKEFERADSCDSVEYVEDYRFNQNLPQIAPAPAKNVFDDLNYIDRERSLSVSDSDDKQVPTHLR